MSPYQSQPAEPPRKSWARFPQAGWLAMLFLTGCVTGGPATPPAMPALLQPLFAACSPGDGASAVQVFEGDSLVGSLEVEWISPAGGNWEVQATNAVGATMLKLTRRGARIASQGRMAGKVPKLAVRKDGYLTVDDHHVGLKASELPCLLSFRLPRPWLNHLKDVETSPDRIAVEVSEPARDVTIIATGLATPKSNGEVCAEMSWRSYLVFRSTLVWCQPLAGDGAATLRRFENYSLKWVRIDESH